MNRYTLATIVGLALLVYAFVQIAYLTIDGVERLAQLPPVMAPSLAMPEPLPRVIIVPTSTAPRVVYARDTYRGITGEWSIQ